MKDRIDVIDKKIEELYSKELNISSQNAVTNYHTNKTLQKIEVLQKELDDLINKNIFECGNCTDWLEEKPSDEEIKIKGYNITELDGKFYIQGVVWSIESSYIFVPPYDTTAPNGLLLMCKSCGDVYAIHENELSKYVNLKDLER